MNSTDSELDRLVSGLVDGVLDTADEVALANLLRINADARRHYLRYMAMHGSLHWDYAGVAARLDGTNQVPSKSKTRINVLVSFMVLATAAALIAFLANGSPSELTVEFADAVTYQSGNGKRELQKGDRIGAGMLRIESVTGSAQFRYDDRTLVTLEGTGSLSFAESHGGKYLDLHEGRLTADVTPQPLSKPLTITTAVAEIEVMGTVLSIEATEETAVVAVDKGRVKILSLTDGQSMEVPANHRVLASFDAGLRIGESAVSSTSWRLRAEGGRPPGLTKGDFVDLDGQSCFTAHPYVAGRSDNGMKLIRSGVAVNGRLVRLSSTSVVKLRYRSENTPTVFLSTVREDGSFGGNVEFEVRANAEAERDKWREVTIPLGHFRSVAKLSHLEFKLEGNEVTKVLVSVHGNRPFEITEIVIDQPENLE